MAELNKPETPEAEPIDEGSTARRELDEELLKFLRGLNSKGNQSKVAKTGLGSLAPKPRFYWHDGKALIQPRVSTLKCLGYQYQ
jgi:hypothetical protein